MLMERLNPAQLGDIKNEDQVLAGDIKNEEDHQRVQRKNNINYLQKDWLPQEPL